MYNCPRNKLGSMTRALSHEIMDKLMNNDDFILSEEWELMQSTCGKTLLITL